MKYINTITKEYPIYEGNIRILYKNTSFPIPFVPPSEFEVVEEVEYPEINPFIEKVVEIDPVKINGVWKQQFKVIPLSEEEIQQINDTKRSSLVATPLQAKVVLYNMGLYEQVENAINSSNNSIIKLAWNNALQFKRTSPAVLEICNTLNFTEEQIDQLFEEAIKIEI